MSLPPSSSLLDRLSPMPMVCPLAKLGRTSPPTADQGYHTALESQVCHHHSSNNDSPENYNLLRSTPNLEQNYHGDKHSAAIAAAAAAAAKKQQHLYVDIYNEQRKNDLIEMQQRCSKPSGLSQKQTENVYQYESRNSPILYNNSHHQGGLYHRMDLCPHQLSDQLQQYCTICEQCSNQSSSSLDCEQPCQQQQKVTSYYRSPPNVDYYQNKSVLEMTTSVWNHQKSSDQQQQFQQQTEAMCRRRNDFYIRNTQENNRVVASSPTTVYSNYLVDNFNKLGKSSPNLDQGYHTLVSPSPGPSMISNPWAAVADNNNITNGGHHLYKGKKTTNSMKNNSFDKLSDDIVLKIFSWLHSYDLSVCARVCRRFEVLAWRPSLWRTITLYGERISGDKAIRGVLRQLCGLGRTGACPSIEKVYLSDGVKLTDRGLTLLARRCPELTHLQIHASIDVTNSALYELVTRCTNLQHLDITGCTNVSCISVVPGPEPPRRLFLQYLDLTDCSGIEDNGLRVIVRNCPQLVYLYLRRCIQITDAGLKHVPSFCLGLRELSVSDCSKVTDFGLYELAKLGATLRYLSVAKCDQVSDAGLKVIARRCYKLRYLNARGCEAVSDDAITVLARSCTRLRALDIGKCDVSDAGLRALAESCPNIKKLSLRNCDLVTDRGVQCIAYYCRGLQQLNIQDCQISLEGYRAVKKYCKRCIIEHTNPGFF